MKVLGGTIASLMVALCLNAQTAPGSDASVPPPSGPMARKAWNPEWFRKILAKRLELTADQQKAMDEIFSKNANGLKAKAQAARQAHMAFREAMRQPGTAVSQLRTLNQNASNARLELMLAHREVREAIRTILTPEQREKMAWVEGFQAGHRMIGHRPFGPGMGPDHLAPMNPDGE